ncbi:putative MFS transporter [Pestalotiopsis sp. NC0098]|nr:putative MFS transporter [Pestalotiopsis sp. NC0098]
MMRLRVLLFLLAALVALVAAESAPTFCKCTCFTNSTIVRLGPKDSASPSPGSSSTNAQSFLRSLNPFTAEPPLSISKRAASSSCAQCTRAFCLAYNLPICKNAEEKDVVTMCFQRDSRKDMIIVWAFIVGTLGLLGWAGVKRAVEYREGKKAAVASGGIGLPSRADRGNYTPVGTTGER